MKRKNLIIFLLFLSIQQLVYSQNLKLWYKQPANSTIKDMDDGWKNDPEWLKALPLGNGSIGAMVFGDVNQERIQLNEKTLWSGSNFDNDNPEAAKYQNEIRNLLFEGKYKEATELTNKTQVCAGAGSGHGNGANVPFGCYQTLGDLYLDFHQTANYSNYRRELNLSNAIVSVFYEQNKIKFFREYFISAPANLLIVRLTANKKGAISFSAFLNRPERYAVHNEDNELVMEGVLHNGKGGDGMRYMARLGVKQSGGNNYFKNNSLIIENANEVILFLSAATDYLPEYPSYNGNDYIGLTKKNIQNALNINYDFLKKQHVDDYQKYFNRVRFTIDSDHTKDSIPTDALMQAVKVTQNDNYLTQLYFQYGRYLLIASSRPYTLPANLQGIWANKIQTPWNCDYHTNINVQMNYWLAENTNLSEMHQALIRFIKQIEKPAEKSARIQFDARGWCINPIVNIWGFTSPGEHPSWGLTPSAGGWICQHLWEHYAFTMDENYLSAIFPTLKKAALFYLDWLVADPVSGKLVSGPASSPENSFQAPDGSNCSISMGPAHDQQIIRELFRNVISAAEILEIQDDVVDKIKAAKPKLLEPQIGSDGRIMEWAKPFLELEPGHRHVSHLYDLYPGNGFFIEEDTAFNAAAKKSLAYRLKHGGGHTGWSAAWVANFWARLFDGNAALGVFNKILGEKSAYNLFGMHPPFQIDGNFGAAAGIAEMLVQSHRGYIELLPALPDQWPDGSIEGLCARGGFDVNIKWKNGEILRVDIKSRAGSKCKLKYRNKIIGFNSEKGKLYSFNNELKAI